MQPDPASQLKAPPPPAQRARPVLELTADKWRGRATVTPVELRRQRQFEVSVAWHGPPMHGYPPFPAVGDRSDLLHVPELELAKAVAMAAVDEIRAGRVPDLRELQRRFERRSEGSIQQSYNELHARRLSAGQASRDTAVPGDASRSTSGSPGRVPPGSRSSGDA